MLSAAAILPAQNVPLDILWFSPEPSVRQLAPTPTVNSVLMVPASAKCVRMGTFSTALPTLASKPSARLSTVTTVSVYPHAEVVRVDFL